MPSLTVSFNRHARFIPSQPVVWVEPCHEDRLSFQTLKELHAEQYFSQSVLLMYGTNCPRLLILVHYHYSCKMCMAWISLAICVCKSSKPFFVYLLGNFQYTNIDWCQGQHWKIMPRSCVMFPEGRRPEGNIAQLRGIIFQWRQWLRSQQTQRRIYIWSA